MLYLRAVLYCVCAQPHITNSIQNLNLDFHSSSVLFLHYLFQDGSLGPSLNSRPPRALPLAQLPALPALPAVPAHPASVVNIRSSLAGQPTTTSVPSIPLSVCSRVALPRRVTSHATRSSARCRFRLLWPWACGRVCGCCARYRPALQCGARGLDDGSREANGSAGRTVAGTGTARRTVCDGLREMGSTMEHFRHASGRCSRFSMDLSLWASIDPLFSRAG